LKKTPEEHFKEALEHVRDLTDMVIWMSGSTDFSPGGTAHLGWTTMQPRLESALEWLGNK